ncbi:unnamed protein product [Ostreobium quekettii]|uniref:Uncharacterized protein n=1 Tax=Ostreobium quekettii TaxID=121088 RepID=A0A8S1IKC8_9CHLO|nr:unnamed protein product [Ostreobium quekettii]|eukprot:evm.model.scf_1492.7 EVM.evm.TU.scf_1492.7   scf_1492:36086-36520(+)
MDSSYPSTGTLLATAALAWPALRTWPHVPPAQRQWQKQLAKKLAGIIVADWEHYEDWQLSSATITVLQSLAIMFRRAQSLAALVEAPQPGAGTLVLPQRRPIGVQLALLCVKHTCICSRMARGSPCTCNASRHVSVLDVAAVPR